MPRANPTASFEVAVRHLFRHLDDVGELRRNPLVKRFFEGQHVGNVHQKSVLVLIRSLIDAGGKDYLAAAGLDERPLALRHVAILQGCMQKRTVKDLAGQLRISLRQCYRERSVIYRFVAEFLRHCESREKQPTATIASAFAIQMDRAALRVANGDYDRAMRTYTGMIDKGDVHQKLDAFIGRVELELELGNLSSAESSLSDLCVLLTADAGELSDTEIRANSAYVELLNARLAWERGLFEKGARTLSSARTASLGFREHASERVRGLCADIALESATRAFDVGEFHATATFLAMARDANNSLPGPNAKAANVLLSEATLSFVTLRPGADVTLHDSMALVSQAQAVALQCGSVKWRLKAEMFLTALQRSSVNVMQRGELILSIAKDLRNPRLCALLSLELADMLLETPSWRQAESLMHTTLPIGSFYAGSFSMLKAVYYLKAGSAVAARRHAKIAHAIAKRAAAPRFEASTLRLLGAASHLLGNDGEAADYILTALPLAEKYGSTTACLKAYRSAALITGRLKYAREAKILARTVER